MTRFHSPRHLHIAFCLALSALPFAAMAQQDFGSTPAPMQQQQPAYPQQGQMPPQGQGYPQHYPTMPQQTPPPQGNTGYPQQPNNGGYPNQPGQMQQPTQAQTQAMQQLLQHELQDFGVQPQSQLQQTMHGPTPTSIPGGQVITTDRVIALVQQGMQGGAGAPLVFHVLGPGPTLPGAQNAAPASQAGSFDDRTQQEFGQYLQQVTQGDKARPMIFYCMNTQCWMSYNAALRAIRMGFTNVLWYRGGIEAWQQAQQMASGMAGGAMPAGNGWTPGG